MTTTRNRIRRPAAPSEPVYTRAGDGPGESIFSDMSEDEKLKGKEELRKQEAAFAAERASRPVPAIRHGVKSERDTQPVQVRMLRAQLKVLKQIAEQEDRSTSDVIRELVDAYIAHCTKHWKKGPHLDILLATIRAENYFAEGHYGSDRAVADMTGAEVVGGTGSGDMRRFEYRLLKKEPGQN